MTEHTVQTTTGEQNVPETRAEEQTLRPPVDIFEMSDGLVVVADLPGVPKEQIDINVHEGVLTIHGKTKQESVGTPLHNEFELRNFYRQFRLTDEVDPESIRAEMKYGVLTVTLPKAEKAKPHRIEVKTSS
ncbi:MAG: Hsp20/alpha crystallin family protein [Candidatus Hydrogenedentota bacterium]